MVPSKIMTEAEMWQALHDAADHVYRQQHAGSHEQDREDARAWMDAHGGGRCHCEKCERDATRVTQKQPTSILP
jgi:DNA-binding helix-hairpin-helix protein with protein kinase domain